MSFEKGSVSFRIFKARLGSQYPEDFVERFAKNAIPAVDAIASEGAVGWATGRHLLDRAITPESISVAGRTRVTLVKTSKKIPAALFKAECRQEELATMAARGVPFLKRQERIEIAKSVRDRMLPGMPPTLSGNDVVRTDDAVYASCTSDSQSDALLYAWHAALGQDLMQYTPYLAAAALCKFDSRSLSPTSFSPTVDDSGMELDIGTEFLTWLWYFSEACGGIDGEFGYMLDGPFTFIHEGSGAHEIVVRRGNPGIASEAKSALMAGKKLKKSRLVIARGKETWMCTLAGSSWTFSGLKLPDSEGGLDAASAFEERMVSIGVFIGAIESVFKRFVAIRSDEAKWDAELVGIRKWVSERASRA